MLKLSVSVCGRSGHSANAQLALVCVCVCACVRVYECVCVLKTLYPLGERNEY